MSPFARRAAAPADTNTIVKVVIIPQFFLWLWNFRIPVGDIEIFAVFLYCFVAAAIVLGMILARGELLMRSSVKAVALLSLLLIPTLLYQAYGGPASFEQNPEGPTGSILKLIAIVVVFVTFNELLAHNYLTIRFLLKVLLVSVLLSIPKYFFENFELLSVLDTGANRPFPVWIGGWNTYAFILSLAFAIIYKTAALSNAVRYTTLTVIFGAMVTTLSRGGVVALMIALLLDWRAQARLKSNPQVGRKTVLAISVVAVVLLLAAPGFRTTVYDRFIASFIESQYEGAGYLQSVSSARSVLWVDTLSKIFSVDHYYQWIFGYGVGHYAYATLHGAETSMGNQYLLLIYEYGLLAGVMLSVMLFRSYSRLRWHSNDRSEEVVKVICAIFLVSNFVEEFTYTTQVGWILGVGAAMVVHLERARQPARSEIAAPGGRTARPSRIQETPSAWGGRRVGAQPRTSPALVGKTPGWRLR